jgi:hypothetical protein
MVRTLGGVTVSAMFLASIALTPASADGGFGGSRGSNASGGFQGFNPAGGFRGFNPAGGFQGFNPGLPARSPVPPRSAKHGRFHPHQRSHRPFSTGGYLIGTYGAPFYYYGSTVADPPYDIPVYAPAPVYTASPVYVPVVVPVASSAVPAAPAPPSVIEYPEGRYELRGDGMSTPYNWVWIPHPPAGPPASTPPPTALSSGDRSPVRRSQLYRWVDAQGVVHLTNNADTVPEQFRQHSKRNDSR